MNLTPLGLLAHAKSEAGRRALRYTATSLFGVAMSQIMLTYFLHVLDWIPWRANLVAVSLTAVPAFILNKRWVWGKRGKAHLRREVIPFWSFTVAGWALSTGAVQLVVSMTRTASNPNGNKLAVQAANIAGFGVLWVLKYMFLDKIMFGPEHHTPYDEDIEIEEAMAGSGQANPAADPAAVDRGAVDRAAVDRAGVDPAAVDR